MSDSPRSEPTDRVPSAGEAPASARSESDQGPLGARTSCPSGLGLSALLARSRATASSAGHLASAAVSAPAGAHRAYGSGPGRALDSDATALLDASSPPPRSVLPRFPPFSEDLLLASPGRGVLDAAFSRPLRAAEPPRSEETPSLRETSTPTPTVAARDRVLAAFREPTLRGWSEYAPDMPGDPDRSYRPDEPFASLDSPPPFVKVSRGPREWRESLASYSRHLAEARETLANLRVAGGAGNTAPGPPSYTYGCKSRHKY